MVVSQADTQAIYALSMAVVIAAIYLIIVRFMDLNEKEHLWMIGLVFFSGVVAATGYFLLTILGPMATVVAEFTSFESSALVIAVAEDSTKFVVFALVVAAFAAIGSWRGWSEIHDLMDGVVYGTALGLGFATENV